MYVFKVYHRLWGGIYILHYMVCVPLPGVCILSNLYRVV